MLPAPSETHVPLFLAANGILAHTAPQELPDSRNSLDSLGGHSVREITGTQAPPPLPLREGYEIYLPELYYVLDTRTVSIAIAQRTTARCVVQWADNYLAILPNQYDGFTLAREGGRRQGPLPAELPARDALLDELFSWADEGSPSANPNLMLFLKSGDAYVMHGEGLLPSLILTPGQFALLQDCWENHGLPRDLYYPASEQLEFVEPVKKYGGIIRMRQVYTPRRAAQRTPEVVARIRIPNDTQRERAMLRACDTLLKATYRRYLELHEPGREVDAAEDERLAKLQAAVLMYLALIQERAVNRWRQGQAKQRRSDSDGDLGRAPAESDDPG